MTRNRIEALREMIARDSTPPGEREAARVALTREVSKQAKAQPSSEPFRYHTRFDRQVVDDYASFLNSLLFDAPPQRAAYTIIFPFGSKPADAEPAEQAHDMGDGRVSVEVLTAAEMHARFSSSEPARLRYAGRTWEAPSSGHVRDASTFPVRFLVTYRKQDLKPTCPNP